MIMLDWELKKYNYLKRRNRHFFLLFLLSFLAFNLTAQTKIWLDQDHQESSEEQAIYYRFPSEKKGNSYYIIDYYKDGAKYREGRAEAMAVGREKFSGLLTYYFQNGTIAKKERYKKGVLNGLYKEYYPSGELRIDGNYDKGYEEGIWKYYHKTGKIKTKGKFKNGEKVGVWKTFYKNVYYLDEG